MHTKDRLAQELKLIGLPQLAAKAADGYYDDYISPLAFPITKLMQDLRHSGVPGAIPLINRVKNGEFDATDEEANDWAESPDGKATLGGLRRKPKT